MAIVRTPTRGTLWLIHEGTSIVTDLHDVGVTEEKDFGSTGRVNARGWPIVDEDVITARRIIIEGDFTTTRHADQTVAQDILDGAALRRLREALPEGSAFDIGSSTESEGWLLDFWSHTYLDHADQHYDGATIAEAADKCREALG